jgi:ABC-2 type transport system ATP-binding protein
VEWAAGRLRWEARLAALELQSPEGSAATREPAVWVRDLRKAYGSRVSLAGVSFDVRTGEVFALLGPNGAGKTTTVEILEGFRAPSGGEVRVLGYDPTTQPLGLRQRVGVVLQECGFPSHLRVAELLDAWRAYYERPRPLGALLEVVELAEQRNALVRELSGGQRRRLDLALALAGDPDLLFLDEPTTGFDPEARRRCWSAIENLRRLGKTVLLTTHYLDEAEHLADRLAVLIDGQIRALGTARELCSQVGLPTRISFRMSGGSQALPPGAARLDDTVVAQTTDSAPTMRSILAWAARRRMSLEDLRVEPPSLEDTYLVLVSAEAIEP